MGISMKKQQIYTIDGLMNCAKIECSTMIMVPTRYKDPSSGANRPSDVAVTLNINAEVNPSLI
jgi:hypothetical protein